MAAMGTQEKGTGNKRERARVARPQATLTAPDLNIQHQIKHPLLRLWMAESGMQLIHMQYAEPHISNHYQPSYPVNFGGY